MNSLKQNLKQTYTYKYFRSILREAAVLIETIGYIGTNLYHSAAYILKGKIDMRKTIEQGARFGVDSLPISLTMVGLTGMIIALQVASEMIKQGAAQYVGALVTIAIVREMGPVMASFGVIAMVGSSMSAEIASMKVTEQIDAIRVLRVDPIKYLLVPRIVAGFVIMPFVVIIASALGILGGFFSSNMVSELNPLVYFDSVRLGLTLKDIWVGLLKGCIFGGIISLVSASIGYKTEGGALEVGKATTNAVVWSFVIIAIVDYIISAMFFN